MARRAIAIVLTAGLGSSCSPVSPPSSHNVANDDEGTASSTGVGAPEDGTATDVPSSLTGAESVDVSTTHDVETVSGTGDGTTSVGTSSSSSTSSSETSSNPDTTPATGVSAETSASVTETGDDTTGDDTTGDTPTYWLGADVSSIQEAVDLGTTYRDTDGEIKPMLALLKNHGFNAIRLRVFVDPLAPYGYASDDLCPGRAEAYNDRDHTVEYAREVKAAGMAFLLDFHYSDTWADPGKQVIPESWRSLDSVDALATAVYDHTMDVLRALGDADAAPDMVQVGNEITPGMLIHVPTVNTDCYGNDSQMTSPNGSASNWGNLGQLLRAGTRAVREFDPEIEVMLHIENTDDLAGVRWWVENAIAEGVDFDVLGLSAYEAFQGPPSTWRSTLQALAASFPDLAFMLAEYNPSRREANDIIRELPEGQGLGTFFWEPTLSGSWGASMFTSQGGTLTANSEDFAEYDQMRLDYGL